MNSIARKSASGTASKESSAARVSELDALRFLAASGVMIYHFTFRPVIHGVMQEDAFGWLAAASRYGYLGVNLFFMISGFVIVWTSQKRSSREFVVSRIARLYPSFWVGVLLTAVIATWIGSAQDLSPSVVAWNLTMMPGPLGQPFVDGVYWTLFVEIKFYFLVFVLMLTRNMPRIETCLWVWLAASAWCATGRAPHWIVSLALYPYGIYFISGAFFFVARRDGFTVARVIALLVACGLGALYAIEQSHDFAHADDIISACVVVTLIALFHCCFVAMILRPGLLPSSRLWFWMGCFTYPLYLLHNRIGRAFWGLLPEQMSPWLGLLITTASVLLLTWPVAAIVERHVCGAFGRWLAAKVGSALANSPARSIGSP